VSYVDAGYSICLTVLFVYGVSLVLRRRRLLRAVDVAERDAAVPPSGPSAVPPAGPSAAPPPGPSAVAAGSDVGSAS
jgi:hypothetical protein